MTTKRLFILLRLLFTVAVLAACGFGPSEPEGAPAPALPPAMCEAIYGDAKVTAAPGTSATVANVKITFDAKCGVVSTESVSGNPIVIPTFTPIVIPTPTPIIIPTLTDTPAPPTPAPPTPSPTENAAPSTATPVQIEATAVTASTGAVTDAPLVAGALTRSSLLTKSELVAAWNANGIFTDLIVALDAKYDEYNAAGAKEGLTSGEQAGMHLKAGSVFWGNFYMKGNLPPDVIVLDSAGGDTYGVFYAPSDFTMPVKGGRGMKLESPLYPEKDLPGYQK